jgi:hypothetical protein
VAYSPVLPLFSAQSGNASSPTVYPAYGGQVLVQIDLNSVTTATVTIEGRVDSSYAWTVLFTVTEATTQANRAGSKSNTVLLSAVAIRLSGQRLRSVRREGRTSEHCPDLDSRPAISPFG